MKRWTTLALFSAAIALLIGLISFRLARAPHSPRPFLPLSTEDDTTAQIKAVTARIVRKHEVSDEVVAGRLSLLEAAAAFRGLDAEGPPNIPVRDVYPDAASDEEAYCLSVLAYVRADAPGERVDEIICRLSDELDAWLCDGTLVLPARAAAAASIRSP